MARNSQKIDPRHMVCENCRYGVCERCVDVSLIAIGREGFCQCKRKGHDGEPMNNQIVDPETNTVYAPGLEVDIDGKVTFHGRNS